MYQLLYPTSGCSMHCMDKSGCDRCDDVFQREQESLHQTIIFWYEFACYSVRIEIWNYLELLVFGPLLSPPLFFSWALLSASLVHFVAGAVTSEKLKCSPGFFTEPGEPRILWEAAPNRTYLKELTRCGGGRSSSWRSYDRSTEESDALPPYFKVVWKMIVRRNHNTG